MAWTLVLADEAGRAIDEVVEYDRKLTFTRNAATAVSFTADLGGKVAADIRSVLANGLPQLRAYQDGVLRGSLLWTPMQEQDGEGDADDVLRAVFRDPFGAVLPYRFTAPSVTYTQTDAGQIGWQLVSTTDAESPTWLRQGTIAATATRDRTYESKQVAEAITQLTQVIDGFDFDVAPVDPESVPGVLGDFNVYSSLGQDRSGSVIFEHGPGTDGNVVTASRYTQLPVNKARVLGENGMYGEASDAASIAKWGLFMQTTMASDGTVEQATLDAKAQDLLRTDPVRVVQFQPDPATAPQPFVDYLPTGDTVAFRSSVLGCDVPVRLTGIAITLDDQGNDDTHELTFEQEVVA